MGSLQEELAAAWEHQRAGRHTAAQEIYLRLAQTEPGNADVWSALGVVCFQLGRFAEAASHFERSLSLRPQSADTLNNLGVACAMQGRFADAESAFRAAVALQPNVASSHRNLGNALRDQRRLKDAAASYREAVRLKADDFDALASLGAALVDLGESADAVPILEAAMCLRPKVASNYYAMGIALTGLGRHDQALSQFEHAVALDPHDPLKLNGLGVAFASKRQYDDAIACFRNALSLKPEYPEALQNLGNALRSLDRLNEAIANYHEALRLRPDYAEAHNNLGIALATLGHYSDAIAAYDRTIAIEPDHALAHKNRGITHLTLGDFERGWPDFEWRWRTKEFHRPTFPKPQWGGESLEAKTILLQAEQGLGDTIQFVRYARLVKSRGARVLVQCQKPLAGLLQNCLGIDVLIPAGEPLPPFDVHAPLMSLPGLLGTTLATIPAPVPYLRADPERVTRWRERLGPRHEGEIRVGISWQGSAEFISDRHRSIPLAEFEPLAQVAGVRLYSLQKGPGAEQIQPVENRFSVTDFGDALDRDGGPFSDTAAIMRCLDVVVAADTSIAHLAGALGVEMWLALSAAADWRWMVGREDSPWYPTARLFRQQELNRWGTVFEQIAQELASETQN
jgi:tetratricopeptide (TPR) repeat protein